MQEDIEIIKLSALQLKFTPTIMENKDKKLKAKILNCECATWGERKTLWLPMNIKARKSTVLVQ